MDYQIVKSERNGIKAVTRIELGQAKEEHSDRIGTRVLEIETGRSYRAGTIETDARVYLISDHCRTHVFGLGSGGDFSKTLAKISGRATEKAIRAAHEAATPMFADAEKAAREYYESGRNRI